MNPYSYILNNPLAGTDPSGYSVDCEGNTCDLSDLSLDEVENVSTEGGDTVVNTTDGNSYKVETVNGNKVGGKSASQSSASPGSVIGNQTSNSLGGSSPSTSQLSRKVSGLDVDCSGPCGGVTGIQTPDPMGEKQVQALAQKLFSTIEGKSMAPDILAKKLHAMFSSLSIINDFEIATAFFVSSTNDTEVFAKGLSVVKMKNGEAGASSIRTKYKGMKFAGDFHTHGRNGDLSYQDFSKFSVGSHNGRTADIPGMINRATNHASFRGGYLSSTDGNLYFFNSSQFVSDSNSNSIGPFSSSTSRDSTALNNYVSRIQ
ncbi:MAG: hypothetical protein L3J46_11795 [Kangiellaceae bacterium]|nr:hypothetical protein [Kangiellaceae bacterium]